MREMILHVYISDSPQPPSPWSKLCESIVSRMEEEGGTITHAKAFRIPEAPEGEIDPDAHYPFDPARLPGWSVLVHGYKE